MDLEKQQEQQQQNVEAKLDISKQQEKQLENLDSKETTKEFKDQMYQKDSKKLIEFIKKDKSESWNNDYYFDWIWNLKDQDMWTKISDFNEPQLSSLIDDYNQKNPNNTIQKESFLSLFRENKPKIIVDEKKSWSVLSDNMEENQKVSEFVLSPEQKQKIQQTFTKILDNQYDISRINLIGKASWDTVTESWKEKAETAINNFLTDLQNKWFDISNLPTYDTIQNQPWFNKEQEDKNPGNHAWAYGRALMQLTALSSEQLKAIPPQNIDFDINPNDVKWDQATWGGIEFFGQSSAETRKIIEQKNEIANQWTNIDFFIRTIDQNWKDSYMNKYFRKEIKENKQTKKADVDIVENFEQQDYMFTWIKGNQKSYIENYMKPKQWEQWKVKLDWDTVYISLSPEMTKKYENILSKWKDLSVEDLVYLYQEVWKENNPQLNNLKNNYIAYEQKQSEINQSLQEKKLNNS